MVQKVKVSYQCCAFKFHIEFHQNLITVYGAHETKIIYDLMENGPCYESMQLKIGIALQILVTSLENEEYFALILCYSLKD
jgi:hypothetical protein